MKQKNLDKARIPDRINGGRRNSCEKPENRLQTCELVTCLLEERIGRTVKSMGMDWTNWVQSLLDYMGAISWLYNGYMVGGNVA